MKALVISLGYFLISLSTYANRMDFLDYNNYVNKAELFFIVDDYKNAIVYYDSAFQYKGNHFAKDVYNASLCAIKTDKLELAITFCKRLADKGVGKSFFSRVPSYLKLEKSKGWKSMLQHAEIVRAQYQKKNESSLALIDSLVAKDQKVNKAWRNSGRAQNEKEIMYLTNDTVSRQLLDIFDTAGFLSEFQIGTILNNEGLISGLLPFDVILIHSYQNHGKGDTIFNITLHDALVSGNITPDYYAIIQDMGSYSSNRPYYGAIRLYYQYKCKLLLDTYDKGRLEKIDNNRAKIGLCNTNDLLKKTLYRITNPKSEFKLTGQITEVGAYANKESEDEMMKTAEIIVQNIPGCK